MRTVMYLTILLFVGIMIVVMIATRSHPVVTVEYKNGVVVEKKE